MNTFSIHGSTITLSPQTATVLRHLRSVGDISGVEAAAMYKVRSLTKRISEINDALYYGTDELPEYTIVGQWSVDNTGQRYKRYVLPKEVRDALSIGRLPVAA